MTTPSPDATETSCERQSTEPSSLPSSNGSSCLFLNRKEQFHDDYHSYNHEPPRVSEVRDEDQMSIERESNSRASGNDEQSREREREDSVSTVITIRNYPLSPLAERGGQYGTEEADYDLARTAEYQRAVFEMLEDWCTDAARKYWRDAAIQTRYCIPRMGAGLHPQRDRRHYPYRMSRSRIDPYPSPGSDFTLPHHYPFRSHIYDIYGLHPEHRDEDTRMSLSPPLSFTEELRNHQPMGFLDLISKITKHMWRTERNHPDAPHRAEYLAARKVWDVWRLAEVVVSAADGVGGCIDQGFGVRCRDEVIGIVEAAGELCDVLGDVVGRERCDDLVLSWVLDDVEEGEILESVE